MISWRCAWSHKRNTVNTVFLLLIIMSMSSWHWPCRVSVVFLANYLRQRLLLTLKCFLRVIIAICRLILCTIWRIRYMIWRYERGTALQNHCCSFFTVRRRQYCYILCWHICQHNSKHSAQKWAINRCQSLVASVTFRYIVRASGGYTGRGRV